MHFFPQKKKPGHFWGQDFLTNRKLKMVNWEPNSGNFPPKPCFWSDNIFILHWLGHFSGVFLASLISGSTWTAWPPRSSTLGALVKKGGVSDLTKDLKQRTVRKWEWMWVQRPPQPAWSLFSLWLRMFLYYSMQGDPYVNWQHFLGVWYSSHQRLMTWSFLVTLGFQ